MVFMQSIKINWTDPEKALTKVYPRKAGEDEDEMPADPGSFFNFFEHNSDPMEVSFLSSPLWAYLRNLRLETIGWVGDSQRSVP